MNKFHSQDSKHYDLSSDSQRVQQSFSHWNLCDKLEVSSPDLKAFHLFLSFCKIFCSRDSPTPRNDYEVAKFRILERLEIILYQALVL